MKYKNRTVRYTNAKHFLKKISEKEYKISKPLLQKLNDMKEDTQIGVRFLIKSDITIEKIIEIGKEDLSELTKDLEE